MARGINFFSFAIVLVLVSLPLALEPVQSSAQSPLPILQERPRFSIDFSFDGKPRFLIGAALMPRCELDLLKSDAVREHLGLSHASSAALVPLIENYQQSVRKSMRSSKGKVKLAEDLGDLLQARKKLVDRLGEPKRVELVTLDRYLLLRSGGPSKFIETFYVDTRDSQDLAERCRATEQEIQARYFEQATELWKETLEEVAELLENAPETKRKFESRIELFSVPVFADITVAELSNSWKKREYSWEQSELVDESETKREIFERLRYVDQFEIQHDGTWERQVLRGDRFVKFNFSNLLHGLQGVPRSFGSEFEQKNSENQIEVQEFQNAEIRDSTTRLLKELEKLSEQSEKEKLSREEVSERRLALNLKHVKEIINDILLPHQNELLLESLENRAQVLKGPLFLLDAPAVADGAKTAIAKSFERFVAATSKLESKLMNDYIATLDNVGLDFDSSLARARPKYLLPSVMLWSPKSGQ